jgi:hypothetical protein
MLPKTKMGDAMWRKLKVYADSKHPHQAQKPALRGGPGSGKAPTKNQTGTREVA